MMIPCIDLQDGRAVQLVHGRERKLAVDDVFGLLDRFGRYPLIHVIDLDAAMRKGSNAKLVRERSEEHTSELQSHLNLVCRLLLEKKKEGSQHVGQFRSDTL